MTKSFSLHALLQCYDDGILTLGEVENTLERELTEENAEWIIDTLPQKLRNSFLAFLDAYRGDHAVDPDEYYIIFGGTHVPMPEEEFKAQMRKAGEEHARRMPLLRRLIQPPVLRDARAGWLQAWPHQHGAEAVRMHRDRLLQQSALVDPSDTQLVQCLQRGAATWTQWLTEHEGVFVQPVSTPEPSIDAVATQAGEASMPALGRLLIANPMHADLVAAWVHALASNSPLLAAHAFRSSLGWMQETPRYVLAGASAEFNYWKTTDQYFAPMVDLAWEALAVTKDDPVLVIPASELLSDVLAAQRRFSDC